MWAFLPVRGSPRRQRSCRRGTTERGERVVQRDAVCVGAGADNTADYFETCRRKRNVIDYTRSHVATETEATEIVKKATEFDGFVEGWIESKFPNLKR